MKDSSFNGAVNITTENTVAEETSEFVDEIISSSNERVVSQSKMLLTRKTIKSVKTGAKEI